MPITAYRVKAEKAFHGLRLVSIRSVLIRHQFRIPITRLSQSARCERGTTGSPAPAGRDRGAR